LPPHPQVFGAAAKGGEKRVPPPSLTRLVAPLFRVSPLVAGRALEGWCAWPMKARPLPLGPIWPLEKYGPHRWTLRNLLEPSDTILEKFRMFFETLK
jgi:hypothetical protein